MIDDHYRFSNGSQEIALYRMECIAGIREKTQPGSVDVVVTSPPYNLGIQYGQYDDSQSRRAYLEWIGEWAGVVHEALAENGSLFLNIGSKPTDPYGPFDVLTELRRHFHLQNVIHWIKSIAIEQEDVGRYPGISRNVAVGHFKPINSRRFLNDCHEYIFHLTKCGSVELDRLAVGIEYQDKSNITRWKKGKDDRRCRGNTWFVPYKTIRSRNEQRPHPATFPVKIPEMCLRLHGLDRIRLAMDPFLGIGNTALACRGLRLNFIGFEIDPEYFKRACQSVCG